MAVTVGNVNLRSTPAGIIIRTLPSGTTVTELVTPTVEAAIGSTTYDWQAVRLNTNELGWLALQFIATPPAPAQQAGVGLHCLENANLSALLASGAKLASATIVDNVGLANQLVANGVPYVLFRRWPDNQDLAIPNDPTQAEAYGHARVRARFAADSQLGAVDLRAYICEDNEVSWSPGHGAFWLGTLRELTAMGRKGALGCYGIGYPEPAQWATMIPALQFAAANGHIVNLHCYCAQGTPLGQLSSDTADYELRFVRLYNAVPADARPPLIIGECAHEFSRGLFEGTDQLVKFVELFSAAVSPYPYVKGFNLWTAGNAGGWDTSCIDSALSDPRVLAFFRVHL